MRRRIQGYIQRIKNDPQQNNPRNGTQAQECQAEKSTGQANDVINIPKDQLIKGIVKEITNIAETPCQLKAGKPDTEISEEFINLVAAKVQERQKQSNQMQRDAQNENISSAQTQLQNLTAGMLSGNKGEQQKQQAANGNSPSNPVLAANDKAMQQNSAQSSDNSKGDRLKENMTADLAAQVLAETQYELSKELEASLQKLREVIEESKQVAQKISNLLDNNANKTKN